MNMQRLPAIPARSVVAGLLLVATFSTAVGQAAPQSVDRSRTCQNCRIDLSPVVTLGAPSDSALLSAFVSAVVVGDRYVASSADITSLIEYDRTGKFIRTVGRKGTGPGEFTAIAAMQVGPGDSIWVHDASRRVSVFTKDLRFVRTFTMRPWLAYAAVLGDSRIIAPMLSGAIDVFSPTGAALRNLVPAPTDSLTRSCGVCMNRVVSRAVARGAIWSAAEHRHEWELRDDRGDLLARMRNNPPWFVPFNTRDSGGAADVRRTRLRGVVEDSNRRLWTISRVPDEIVARLSDAEIVARMRSPEGNLTIYDHVVEIVDLTTNRLLGTRRFDGLAFFLQPGLIAEIRQDSNGYVSLHVSRIVLSGFSGLN